MNWLWTSQELASLLGTDKAPCAQGLSIDSRTLKAGDLFFALRGPHFDGHHFVQDALAKGASGCVVEAEKADFPGTFPVDDPFATLKELAQASRARFKGKILALTGSVGKTTVKEGLIHVLHKQHPTFGTYGSFNNTLGLPLSMARMPRDKAFGIFELGMSHAGEIKDLTAQLRPHVGLITNVSYQHGENFSSIEGIARAKAELFDTLLPQDRAVLWRDDPHFDLLKKSIKGSFLTFGKKEADICWLKTRILESGTSEIHVKVKGKNIVYVLPRAHEHQINNSLAILASLVALGADVEQGAQDLKTIPQVPGRGQVLSIAGIDVIDESYNAAPQAVQAVLKSYTHFLTKRKKYVLLGEMRALGLLSQQYHLDLLPFLQNVKADGVWFCGLQTKELADALRETLSWQEDVQSLVPEILETLKPGDSLLVKGARSMKTFLAIDALYQFYGLSQEALNYPLRTYF